MFKHLPAWIGIILFVSVVATNEAVSVSPVLLEEGCDSDFIASFAQIFRRLASSDKFAQYYFEESPIVFRAADTRLPIPNFGYANLSQAAQAGALGSTWDSHFSDTDGEGERSFVLDTRLVQTGRAMSPDILEEHFARGGTLSVNMAGVVWGWVGCLCSAAMRHLRLFANVNLYATRHGARIAVPPHNDRQDVFVLQTSGAKRWRLWPPAGAQRLPRADAERGKSGDVLRDDELGDPSHDVVLYPGDVLYVPRGYLHATSTVAPGGGGGGSGGSGKRRLGPESNLSVSLTVGIETAVMQYTYESALTCLAARAQYNPAVGLDIAGAAVTAVRAAADKDVSLRRALPLGFLARGVSQNTSGTGPAPGPSKFESSPPPPSQPRPAAVAAAAAAAGAGGWEARAAVEMRRLLQGPVAVDFPDAEKRLKISDRDYLQVLELFDASRDTFLRESFIVYKAAMGAGANKASDRRRSESERLLSHSKTLLGRCGISLSDT